MNHFRHLATTIPNVSSQYPVMHFTWIPKWTKQKVQGEFSTKQHIPITIPENTERKQKPRKKTPTQKERKKQQSACHTPIIIPIPDA